MPNRRVCVFAAVSYWQCYGRHNCISQKPRLWKCSYFRSKPCQHEMASEQDFAASRCETTMLKAVRVPAIYPWTTIPSELVESEVSFWKGSMAFPEALSELEAMGGHSHNVVGGDCEFGATFKEGTRGGRWILLSLRLPTIEAVRAFWLSSIQEGKKKLWLFWKYVIVTKYLFTEGGRGRAFAHYGLGHNMRDCSPTWKLSKLGLPWGVMNSSINPQNVLEGQKRSSNLYWTFHKLNFGIDYLLTILNIFSTFLEAPLLPFCVVYLTSQSEP